MIRSIFLPQNEDHLIVTTDFNGQELRIVASESKSPVMLDAYIGENPKDLHSIAGVEIAEDLAHFKGLDLGDWSREYEDFINRLDDPVFEYIRFAAKAINFTITFVGTEYSVADTLGIPVSRAKEIFYKIFNYYEGLGEWQDQVKQFVKKYLYTKTAYGNRRHFKHEDANSSDLAVRSRIERQAVNYIIQGCAADILKVVLRKCKEQEIFESLDKAKLIAPVYDEIISSVNKSFIVEYVIRLKDIMSLTPPGHQVPMVPEFSIGRSWSDKTKLGIDFNESDIERVINEYR